ncbi:hypothetical protein [Cloacibacterium rupense]|uniref:hypothetical protein n=1 Tax=Cloacibacterium rupense TaxID=517423 RepID=UPI001663945B|nr:hypothetical protein [Cloacibacterium rupense]
MTSPTPSQLICKTGAPCPESGLWESMGFFKTTIVISKKSKMPDYCGKKVSWRLLMKG